MCRGRSTEEKNNAVYKASSYEPLQYRNPHKISANLYMFTIRHLALDFCRLPVRTYPAQLLYESIGCIRASDTPYIFRGLLTIFFKNGQFCPF